MAAIAAALGLEVVPAHGDSSSALWLDRPPLRWATPGARGLAWSEGCIGPGVVSSWSEAACRWAACGLVLEGGRRYVHTSVAGIAPLYHLEVARATYFASRIEALLEASEGVLSVDWDAWAAIFFLRHPLGARTPFLEVRRAEPFSRLEHRSPGGARVSTGRWPWAEVEPKLSDTAGAGPIVEAARSAIGRLPAERFLCPLSGGWDSRLLLCLLAEERPSRVVATFTGRLMSSRDAHLAPPVAAALDVPNTLVEAAGDGFPSDFAASAEHLEHQWVPRGAFVPLATRLRSEAALIERVDRLAGSLPVRLAATDGLGLGILFGRYQVGSRGGSDRAGIAGAIWDKLARPGAEGVLSPPLTRALADSARRQLQTATDRWRGHPAQSLTVYLTRTVRGVSLGPVAELGRNLAVATPTWTTR